MGLLITLDLHLDGGVLPGNIDPYRRPMRHRLTHEGLVRALSVVNRTIWANPDLARPGSAIDVQTGIGTVSYRFEFASDPPVPESHDPDDYPDL